MKNHLLYHKHCTLVLYFNSFFVSLFVVTMQHAIVWIVENVIFEFFDEFNYVY